MFLGTLQHGSCVVQPTKLNYDSEELIDMINRCGLNRLNAFGSWLGMHLKNSRQDAKLLSLLLRGMRGKTVQLAQFLGLLYRRPHAHTARRGLALGERVI